MSIKLRKSAPNAVRVLFEFLKTNPEPNALEIKKLVETSFDTFFFPRRKRFLSAGLVREEIFIYDLESQEQKNKVISVCSKIEGILPKVVEAISDRIMLMRPKSLHLKFF